MSRDEGRLKSGFEGQLCVNAECRAPLTYEGGVYLHRNRDTDKLVLFCEGCSQRAQLNDALRFPLVAL